MCTCAGQHFYFLDMISILGGEGAYKKDKTEEKAKVVAVGWGTYVLQCRTNHLVARMIWAKDFMKTSILEGW